MECPECQTHNPDGQKFCGSCGRIKDAAYIQNQMTNLPDSKFCGQCGSSLPMVGSITLARSGLITLVGQKTLDMLGYDQGEMHGKPFSLFVESADLVIFFSRLNEMLSGAKKQSFEIALKRKNKNNIYVQLECWADQHTSTSIETIQISLTETTNSHNAATHMQAQQDLLSLIFTITDNISTVNQEHLARSIEDALKKISLFTKADRCFIYSINRPSFRLDPVHEWRQPIASLQGVKVKSKNVSLSKLKRIMARLRQEKMIVVQDTDKLEPQERKELLDWLHVDSGALICHVLYSEKLPIGIIGVFKNTITDGWEPDYITLVKFFGDFIANRLPFSAIDSKSAGKPEPVTARPEKAGKKLRANTPGNVVDMSDIDPSFDEDFKKVQAEPAGRSSMENGMRFEKFSGAHPADKQSVFERGDGLVLLTCPQCGIQEAVSVGQFDTMGNAIRATCPCKKQFTAVLEKQRLYRKSVHLEGYFSLGEHFEPTAASSSTWGPMVVKDLSKTGLRFLSDKTKFIHPGELLMVRFNLDNANQALIQKPARVISITGHEVGCQFEGADSYDITLGFYFM
ncbi:MAG: PilZ domain-containing protein [Deltaproteobacteria bacterium]|nr:PilZ domain-containing protein [Deltaproteobacteria bacterium]